MIKRTITLAKRFDSYQRERFPIIVLVLSLMPAALSSGVIVSAHPTIFQIIVAVIASVAYLLHIRVIDEHRDFGHDNQHHVTRPVQSGIISKQELQIVDIIAVLLLISIAITAGSTAIIMVVIMLVYSYLAGKEFFLGEGIRRHFFIYNSINLVQMLLMQIFVYAIFANKFPFTVLILAHFLFTTAGTIIFEFIRKVKRPGDDGTGKDTYTWYLGFNNSLIIYSVLFLLNTVFFFWVSTIISSRWIFAMFLSIVMVGFAYIAVFQHWIKKSVKTDQLMQLSAVSIYGIYNIVIFILALNLWK